MFRRLIRSKVHNVVVVIPMLFSTSNPDFNLTQDNECLGCEFLTAVDMKVAIFWDISQCSLHMNQRFGGTYHLHLQDKKSAEQETYVPAS
jgi:hypothetical protein